jgi:hypothetical protein
MTTNHPSEEQAMTTLEARTELLALMNGVSPRLTSAQRDACWVALGALKEASPPPDSIEIRIGVAMTERGIYSAYPAIDLGDEETVEQAIELLGSDDTPLTTAIVVAHLPKPQIRVIQGNVEQVKGHE